MLGSFPDGLHAGTEFLVRPVVAGLTAGVDVLGLEPVLPRVDKPLLGPLEAVLDVAFTFSTPLMQLSSARPTTVPKIATA